MARNAQGGPLRGCLPARGGEAKEEEWTPLVVHQYPRVGCDHGELHTGKEGHFPYSSKSDPCQGSSGAAVETFGEVESTPWQLQISDFGLPIDGPTNVDDSGLQIDD